MNSVVDKIHQATLKLLYPMSLEDTCTIIGKEAEKLAKADYCTLLLFQQGQFRRAYSSDPFLGQSKPRKNGINYQVFKKRQPMIMDLQSVKSSPVHTIAAKLGIKSMMSVPLSYRNQSWGVLSVHSKKENFFKEEHLSVLQLFSSLATLALRKTQLYDEAKSALQSRDLFISMAAHELRTPITTINGYAQLLYSKLSGANTSESRWVEELSWETVRLTQLVNELLEVERIKVGQLSYNLKECHLKEIIQRAIKDFRFTFPDHKIILTDQIKEGDDLVVGDFDKLLQVIINLLDNAAKFSSKELEINVILKSRFPDVVVTIKDKGSGIAKKDINGIFDKFYRADTHDREGMGLGLFLVKNIVKQHHGNINIHSKEGRGTKVEIKLPQKKHG